jgi:hypothetical protein
LSNAHALGRRRAERRIQRARTVAAGVAGAPRQGRGSPIGRCELDAVEVAHVDDDLLHLVRRSGQTEMHAVFNLGGTARTMAMPRADARTQWCGGARPTPTTLDLPPGAAWFGLGDA